MERTILAWNRTGLTFVATGAAVLRLLSPMGRGVVGVAMVVIGAVIATYGWRRTTPASAGRPIRLLAIATTVLAVVVVGAAV
jgi:uncharacterized membrane protein YidH (DUF202 family)